MVVAIAMVAVQVPSLLWRRAVLTSGRLCQFSVPDRISDALSRESLLAVLVVTLVSRHVRLTTRPVVNLLSGIFTFSAQPTYAAIVADAKCGQVFRLATNVTGLIHAESHGEYAMTRSKYRDAAEAKAAAREQNRAWQQLHRPRARRFFAKARLEPHVVPEFERPVAPPAIPPVHQCIRTVQPPVPGSIAFALLYGR